MRVGTLEDWLRAPPSAALEHDHHEPDVERERDAKLAQIETVLNAWRTWRGNFSAFCEHVRRDLRLELGKTLIANIPFARGVRRPARRPGRSRDEHTLRGAFETFFAGAQWVADGKRVEVVIDGEVLHVNLEFVVDAATDAAVGIDVRAEENSGALVAAFEDGKLTTGEAPLALLVDNRPSNHTPEVDAALGDTLRIDATPARPQNKAHVEGAFGLFAQKLPALVLDTTDSRALARSIALIVAMTFFRALNRAPRRDRAGRSRLELYAQDVTTEEREAARTSLQITSSVRCYASATAFSVRQPSTPDLMRSPTGSSPRTASLTGSSGSTRSCSWLRPSRTRAMSSRAAVRDASMHASRLARTSDIASSASCCEACARSREPTVHAATPARCEPRVPPRLGPQTRSPHLARPHRGQPIQARETPTNHGRGQSHRACLPPYNALKSSGILAW